MTATSAYSYTYTINIYPDEIGSTDNTTEALSEIQADDAPALGTFDSDIVASVAVGDGVYTSDNKKIMYFSYFGTSSLPSDSVITGAILYAEWVAQDGYGPTTGFVRYWNGSVLVNTSPTLTTTDTVVVLSERVILGVILGRRPNLITLTSQCELLRLHLLILFKLMVYRCELTM